MLTVLATIAPIFALIGTGFAFGRLRGLGPEAVSLLNSFVVWLALPALLFRAMADARWTDIWQPGFLLAFTGGIAAAFVIGMAGAGPGLSRRALDGLSAAYSNTAFLGIPIASVLIGPVGLSAAIIATLLTVWAVFAVTIALVEYERNTGGGLGRSLAGTAGSVLRNPIVLAPLAGGIWGALGLPMPAPAHHFADLLGSTSAPCALVTIGMFLALRRAPGTEIGTPRRLSIVLAAKLIVQPAVTAFIALVLLDMPRPWAAAAILLAALPTGTGPFMLAELYGYEAGLVSRTILLSTILSIASVTALATLLLY